MERAKVNVISDLEEWKGICIIGEQRNGRICDITYELIGKGRILADKKSVTLSVVICGWNMNQAMEDLAQYPVDRVIYLEKECLENYSTQGYVSALYDFVKDSKPEALIIGATSLGRDLAPRLAARLGTGLTADCTELDIDEDDGKMLQTRPAFGGNLMATIICPKNRPQMSTVRPGVMSKAEKSGNKAEIIKITPAVSENDITVKLVEFVKAAKKSVSLNDADVIVAGGRGVGSKENFDLLFKLAQILGGEVACSRAAVDSGWIGAEHQVGQTGAIVRPKLYIACGISGAIQHVTGMQDADCIVAINTNASAPIFKIADYGLVGDMFEIIPKMIDMLQDQ